MARLASGSKGPVDMKEMKRLTLKNYGNLPEIIRKKEQEKKKEDEVAKRARAAAYQKELDQRIR
jgi:phage FluMu protein gp41